MSTVPANDAALTAWLCTHLPTLTDAADNQGWVHKLTSALTDIRAGAPVARALANHHLPIDLIDVGREQAAISRGDPSTLTDLGIDPVAVTGAYTCPAAVPCPRRARPDARGYEPRCGVHGVTMTLRGR